LHLPFAFSGSKEGLRSRELSLQAASEIVAVTRIMEKTNEVYWYVCMYVRLCLHISLAVAMSHLFSIPFAESLG
jgi:hypothetical protein